MKNKTAICMIIIVLLFSAAVTAQDSTRKKDSTYSRSYVDSLDKAHNAIQKIYIDSLRLLTKPVTVAQDRKWRELRPLTNLIIVIAFFVVMIILLTYFFKHLKAHGQRIGYQSIKLIGLILIFPGICILAIVGGPDVLSGQTLAVLLGTIAGYVLSRDDDSKDTKPKEGVKSKDEYEKKVTVLEQAITEQDKTIADLRSKIKTE